MTHEHSTVMAGTPHAGGQMTREEIVAFFDRRQHAYDDLNAARLAADYGDDCIVDSPTGGTHQGRAAVEQVFRAVFDAFLDLKIRTDSLVVEGNRVAHVLNVEGTNIGEFLGVPPSGKPFHLVAVFLYEFKDRQIIRERRIYDFTGLLVQVGVLKARPV